MVNQIKCKLVGSNMFRIVVILCFSKHVVAQENFHNIDDNIAMETVSGKNLDFSNYGTNRFSTFLSRAGDFFSDSDFGNKIVSEAEKPEVIHAVRVVEVSEEEEETNFTNKKEPDDKSLRNLTNQVKSEKLTGSNISTSLVSTLLAGGKDVDDMQDELKNLLFGEEDAEIVEYIGKPSDSTKINKNITRAALQKQRKLTQRLPMIDGDRAEFEEYDPVDYDMYSYDNQMVSNRRIDAELPTPAELRQRQPYRPPRRRPMRGPIRPTSLRSQNIPKRHNSPPIRAPELHKVPGRIQGLQIDRNHNVPYSTGQNRDPFKQSVFGEGLNSKLDCDFYTEDLCLGVSEYPRQEIVRLLGANRRISDDMIADVSLQSADELIDGVSSNQENTYDFNHYFGNRREDDSHKHRDFAQDGGFLCPSEIKYAKPKRGKTAQGTWKDIVNVNDYTQTLRMEKCLKPGGSCSYVSHHYKSQCSQVYNYHRLLSWDQERGLHMDIYKVPTCCSCHIMGYSYVYPPLKKGAEQSLGVHGPPGSGSSPLSLPPQRPLPTTQDSFQPPQQASRPAPQPSRPAPQPSRPAPQPSRPAPQLTSDNFPQQELDNFIPDFNPQEELQAFMQSIGDDFKDFNFAKSSRPARNNQRPGPPRLPGNSQFRPPAVGGFQPISGDLRPPPPRNRRRGQNSIRRGDGFGPGGKPIVESPGLYQAANDDPLHKYETIPLEGSTSGFSQKKLKTGRREEEGRREEQKEEEDEEGESDSVNYGYHPIIDFFTPYRD